MPAPELGPIGLAQPAGIMDRAKSLEVGRCLHPSTVSENVLARLHDRSGIERRAIAILEPDGAIPLYGIDASGERRSQTIPTTAERMRAYREHATPVALEAATQALMRAGVDTDAVTHLVTASCTGFAAPGVDLDLIDRLGLAPTVRRSHLGFMGCHAAVNALAVAAALARESPTARVLVVCVEISSVHFHHDDRLDHVISNILFADGAGAAIVGHDLEHAIGRIERTASKVFPGSGDAMGWHIGDHGFEMTLDAEVPALIGGGLPAWLRDDVGLDSASVGGWAIHPGGPKVIDTVVEGLELREDAADASREVLRTCGNMSSATLLHIIDRLHASKIPTPWIGLAFGPGLAGELVAIR